MSDAPTRKQRPAKQRRHPFLEGKDKKVWHPEAVGIVPRYAKTAEAFKKRQEHGSRNMAAVKASGREFSRRGVPDGFARRREGVESFTALAKHEAARIMTYLRKEDLLVEPDNEIANDALKVAIELSRNPSVPPQLHLAAAKVVLEYTRAKPAQKSEVTLRTAESFLDDIASESLAATR